MSNKKWPDRPSGPGLWWAYNEMFCKDGPVPCLVKILGPNKWKATFIGSPQPYLFGPGSGWGWAKQKRPATPKSLAVTG